MSGENDDDNDEFGLEPRQGRNPDRTKEAFDAMHALSQTNEFKDAEEKLRRIGAKLILNITFDDTGLTRAGKPG